MRIGKRTLFFDNPCSITASSSIVGPIEKKSDYASFFDEILDDDMFGEKSYEKAERKLQIRAVQQLLYNSKHSIDEIDLAISGDLINQITVSSFACRQLNLPFIGVYNACASFGESLFLGASLMDSLNYDNIVCLTSSHFSSAERQYRFPLELGNQKTPLSQWTVTGAGSVMLSKEENITKITGSTLGTITDYGILDVNNMGASMAPSVFTTLQTHLKETRRNTSYYDYIITGDLGKFGSKLLKQLCSQNGIQLNNHIDCGAIIYGDNKKAIQGGSGAGCCSVMFAGYFYKLLQQRKINKVLFMPTGALLSKDTSLQGESIPAICHAIIIENIYK